MAYQVVFASERVERIFLKALEKIPTDYQSAVVQAIRSLSSTPRPQGKRIKRLKGLVTVSRFTAEYRLRIGPYRILYDVDDERKKIILLKLAKRDEQTYD